jgi:hypothetical protein
MVSKRRTLKGGAAIFSLALVAVLALSALNAGAASAAEAPRWSVKGAYLGAGATKSFTATSSSEVTLSFGCGGCNVVKLASPAGECSETGEIEGSAAGVPGIKKTTVLTCNKVKVFAEGKEQPNCTVRSAGAEIGTIKTNSLKSTLVWLNQTGGAAGDLIEPTSGTSWATIEILGAACGAKSKSNLTQMAINEILPVEEEADTQQLNLPSAAITNYYNNEASRAKQTITQLKQGSATATLSGKFTFSLSSKEKVGVSPIAGSGASRWKVGGWFLGAGVTKPFTATSIGTIFWEMPDLGTILKMPNAQVPGSSLGAPPGRPAVNRTCS